jgi:hypothetical protein
MQKIRDALRDEPSKHVVKMCVEQRQAIQWRLFKQKCVKGMVEVELAAAARATEGSRGP